MSKTLNAAFLCMQHMILKLRYTYMEQRLAHGAIRQLCSEAKTCYIKYNKKGRQPIVRGGGHQR